MASQTFIVIAQICTHYKIEVSFIDELENIGLISIQEHESERCIHEDHIADLEKMIRLHHDLNVNIEGIDVVFNLLEKEKKLQAELVALQNKLSRYETD